MLFNFCTLFDKNYLYKGLALHNSLLRNCDDFRLFILSMDDETYDILNKLNLEKVELISLEEFEDSELKEVKKTRTIGEYCWTCTSSLLFFLLKNYSNLEMITYLDADLFFFSNPQPIYNEFGNNSILLTEHNFSDDLPKFFISRHGKYNVQFTIFKNDENSLQALKWWREKTIEWCYNRHEGGKFGDQLYLNDWLQRFNGVYVLENNKFWLAPWNVSKYNIFFKDGYLWVEDTKLVFYHFHTFKMISENKFNLANSPFKIEKRVKDLIYQPYINEIKLVIEKIKRVDPSFKYGFEKISMRQKMKNLIKSLFYGSYRKIKNL